MYLKLKQQTLEGFQAGPYIDTNKLPTWFLRKNPDFTKQNLLVFASVGEHVIATGDWIFNTGSDIVILSDTAMNDLCGW